MAKGKGGNKILISVPMKQILVKPLTIQTDFKYTARNSIYQHYRRNHRTFQTQFSKYRPGLNPRFIRTLVFIKIRPSLQKLKLRSIIYINQVLNNFYVNSNSSKNIEMQHQKANISINLRIIYTTKYCLSIYL